MAMVTLRSERVAETARGELAGGFAKMDARFASFGTVRWADAVVEGRIDAARESLRAFDVSPTDRPLGFAPHLPLTGRNSACADGRRTALAVAARLLAALDGNETAWQEAEYGLHYLLAFDRCFDYPDNTAAHVLLWIAGVLCRRHPWARWWLYAGTMRLGKLLGGHLLDYGTSWESADPHLIAATCAFARRFPGRDTAIPSGTATAIGRHAEWPSVGDLTTEATHLDEVAFAREMGWCVETEPNLVELRRTVAARAGERLAVLANDIFLQQVLEMPVDAAEIADARDNVLILRAHMFRRHDFGRTVEWSMYLDGDREFCVGLNGGTHILALARDWHQNRNEASARAAVRLWRSWLDQSPIPPNWSIGQWRTLDTAVRNFRNWPAAAVALLEREDFRSLVLPDVARCMFLTLPYYVAYTGILSNWLQIETAGALVGLELFSEWPEAERLRALFGERLRWINQAFFLPDGMQAENTPGYHVFPWQAEVAAANQIGTLGGEPPPGLWDLLDRGAEPLWKLRLPDGTLPEFSDSGPSQIRVDAVLEQYARFRGRPDLAGVLHPERNGLPEPHTRLEYAGYSVVRSGWDKHDAALAFDHGYFGSNHQHEDKLNFIYHARGRRLIGDAVICRYSRDAFERYFRGAWGHNAITIDGGQQASICRLIEGHDERRPRVWPLPDPSSGWLPGTERSLLWGAYLDGFARRQASLWDSIERHRATCATIDRDWIHRRVIAFFGNDGIVVIDRVESSAKEGGQHELELIFHLYPILDDRGTYEAPGTLRMEKDGFRLTHGGRTGVLLSHVGEALELRSWCGSKDPVRGYTAIGGEMPSHDVAFAATVTFPVTWATVIEPTVDDASGRGLAAAWRAPDVIEIRTPSGTHSVRLLPDGAAWT